MSIAVPEDWVERVLNQLGPKEEKQPIHRLAERLNCTPEQVPKIALPAIMVRREKQDAHGQTYLASRLCIDGSRMESAAARASQEAADHLGTVLTSADLPTLCQRRMSDILIQTARRHVPHSQVGTVDADAAYYNTILAAN